MENVVYKHKYNVRTMHKSVNEALQNRGSRFPRTLLLRGRREGGGRRGCGVGDLGRRTPVGPTSFIFMQILANNFINDRWLAHPLLGNLEFTTDCM